MSVLMLAAEHDRSADRLVLALRDREAIVHRVNTRWFPQAMSLSATLRDGRWTGALRTADRTIDLESITAVWFRSPETFAVPDDLSDAERRHVLAEAKYGVGGVLASLPARWVDPPSRQADAAYKPVQLVAAARAGLATPDTVITNEAPTVTAFAATEQPAVTKTFANSLVQEDGAAHFVRTHLIAPEDLADLRGVEHTAHLVQRWVPKDHEVRVVVIGETTTAVAIFAGSEAAHVDWRRDYTALSYEVVEMPLDVADGVARLMAEFGLRFGALDFVVGPGGEWVFLELNPTGIVDWLEAATGEPFAARLASLLLTGQAEP